MVFHPLVVVGLQEKTAAGASHRLPLPHAEHPSWLNCLTQFVLVSFYSAALEMEFLPLWLCLGFHFLVVEWRDGSGTATAASQGGCKAVSVSLDSALSFVPVLMRLAWKADDLSIEEGRE